MKRWAYDLTVAVVAGFIVFFVADGLDWLEGWQAWAASVLVAVITLTLLVCLIRRRPARDPASGHPSDGYRFLSGVSTDKDIELEDTTVESSGSQASHLSDTHSDGSIKITGSKFLHNKVTRGDGSDG